MKKKILIVSILFVIIGFFTFNLINVKADSGWDSDYDFGGSDWSSSDWGSSDYDWDSSDYSYHGGSSSGSGWGAFFWFVIILAIIIISANNKHHKGYNPGPRQYQGNSDFSASIDEAMIQEHIPGFNKAAFLNKAYDNFINVQNAWSEFDYNKLRSLLTDELYNTYHTQLVALKAKKQKNIMSDFEAKNIDITGMDVKDNKITLIVSLTVAFYDYVVDKDDNVVRGTKSYKLNNSYDLTFVSTLDEKKKKKQKVCPSCGAPLENTSSNVCPFCNSTIVFDDHDWILSKKEMRR